jgi:hypothetical protein
MFKLLFLVVFFHLDASESLKKSDAEFLNKNKWQTTVEKVKGKVWPKITIKALIESTPLKSAAIFSAFDYQKNYIPDMVVSKVISQPKPTEVHVYYELDMPWPVSKGIYTNGHNISAPSKDEYKISWYSISSDIADDLKGSAHFIPYNNKTLLIYETHVDPKSFFAGIFKKLMVRDVEKSLKKIVSTIEKKQHEPDFMKKYTQKLQNALSGISSY